MRLFLVIRSHLFFWNVSWRKSEAGSLSEINRRCWLSVVAREFWPKMCRWNKKTM